MIMIFGIILNGREWQHALYRSLITLCCRSISGTCSDAEAVFNYTPIFSRAVLIGTNSPSMSVMIRAVNRLQRQIPLTARPP